MTTTAPERISLPTFDIAFEDLVSLALANPDREARHHYTFDGGSHCLLGSAYRVWGGDLRIFEPFNSKTLRHVAGDIFTDDFLFLGMSRDQDVASRYLTYILMSFIQKAQDNSSTAAWGKAIIKALRDFRKFLVFPTSGFLVQTQGAHEDLLAYALKRVDNAIITASA